MLTIYKIVSPSGKVYIGQSTDIYNRVKIYRQLRCKGQPKLYASLSKYGWDQHVFSILVELPDDSPQYVLDNYEIFFIAQYKEANFKMLNIKEGGLGGKHSKESIEKMKAASANGRHNWKNRKHSEETKNKISQLHKGRKLSECRKELIRLSLLGKKQSEEARLKNVLAHTGSNNHFYGKKHDEETRKRMSMGKKIGFLKRFINKLKSQKMSTENSPTKLIIKNARLSYANIWEPKAMLDKQGKPQGEPKYSVALLIPKSDKVQVAAINAAIEAAKEQGKASIWKGKIPNNLKAGLRDGDSKDEDPSGAYAGHWFINASSKQAPGVLEVVSGKKVVMTDKTHLYSGCYAHVSVNFYPFDNMSNGVACGLNNILKVKDGEALGGRASAESDFADVEVDTDVDDTDDL